MSDTKASNTGISNTRESNASHTTLSNEGLCSTRMCFTSMQDTRRLLSCFLVCLAPFTQGVMYVWNSFAVPQLIGASNMKNTDFMISYVSSSHSVGCAVGALFSGLIVNCGPLHRVIPIISLLTAVAWTVMALVDNLCIIVVTKFFVGFLIVLECSSVPLYIASVSPENYSGFFLSLFSVTRSLSQIAVSASAQTGLSYSTLTLAFAVVPSLLLASSIIGLADENVHKSNKEPKKKVSIFSS